MTELTIGVLALQGDVREHARCLEEVGARCVRVRRVEELQGLDGLVLPGGESTTMDHLLRVFDLREPLQEALQAGMPAYGSCAGMIMLAGEVSNGKAGQRGLEVMNITVRRNAFGSQVDSFEDDVQVKGVDEPVKGVFIRAPWVENVGPDVEVLATCPRSLVPDGGDPQTPPPAVAVKQGPWLATSFHPELTGQLHIHRIFVDMVKASR